MEVLSDSEVGRVLKLVERIRSMEDDGIASRQEVDSLIVHLIALGGRGDVQNLKNWVNEPDRVLKNWLEGNGFRQRKD
jgi:hypothetical protein